MGSRLRRVAQLVSLVVALAGCEAPAVSESWQLSDSTGLEFDLGEPGQREVADGRVRWRLESGLTVTVQELAADDRMPEGRRTARSVADALTTRLELGEHNGELSTHRCRAGPVDAECVIGWMEYREQRFARCGAVLEAGQRIVWIDVSAPDERRDEVERRCGEILDSLTIDPASPG